MRRKIWNIKKGDIKPGFYMVLVNESGGSSFLSVKPEDMKKFIINVLGAEE